MAEISSNPGTHLRTILIGVTTTVLGTAAVWYLGFHPKGSAPDFLIVKDATITAWKTYVAAENTFTANWKMINDEYSKDRFQKYKQDQKEELDMLTNKLKKILTSPNIDPLLVSLIEREVQLNDQWWKRRISYLDNFERISNSDLTQDEKNKKLDEETNRFNEDVKSINGRFINELDDDCRTLTNKYGGGNSGYTFSRTDMVKYQTTGNQNNNTGGGGSGTGGEAGIDKQMLVGDWMVGDKWYIYQYNDGRLYMYFTRTDGNMDSVYGTWQVNGNRLQHNSNYYFSAGGKWIYNISNLTGNSFVMTLVDSPFTQYTVQRRTNVNNNTSSSTINRQMLVGEWKVSGDYMYQYDDGRFYIYYSNGDSAYGTWNLNNDILSLQYGHFNSDKKTQYTYKLYNQTNNAFSAESIDASHYTFVANRVK